MAASYRLRKALQRDHDIRYILSEAQTNTAIGLMLQPIPGETAQVFSFNFGPTYNPETLVNLHEFPELVQLEFFGIEYLNPDEWQQLKPVPIEPAPPKGYLLKIGISAHGLARRFMAYDATGSTLIALPIWQPLSEGDSVFSRDYGPLTSRQEFINIDSFPELIGIRNAALEYSGSTCDFQPVEMAFSGLNPDWVEVKKFRVQDYQGVLLAYGSEDHELVGSVIASRPGESASDFSKLYGTALMSHQFLNIRDFPALNTAQFLAIAPFVGELGVKPLFHDPSGSAGSVPVADPSPMPLSSSPLSKKRKTAVPAPNTSLTQPAPLTPAAALLQTDLDPTGGDKTYLELSEAEGGSHKFYEVRVNGCEVRVRYGRIGDQGQTQTKTYPTPDKAKADAAKKIKEKLSKGYEPAVIGGRQKRAVTRREVASAPAVKGVKAAPVLWKFGSGSIAFGIFVDGQRCWVGNQNGQIFALDLQGQVLTQFQLPEGVKCIVSDGAWLYAGCDDGKVYDLTGKVPRVAYEIDPSVDIYWLDIRDGILGVSDSAGQVTTISHEDESQWIRKSRGDRGWMVRCDEIGVYHGHSQGVTMYDWEDGRELWFQKTDPVLFGWQEEAVVYAGTSGGRVYSFSKQGELGAVYQCDQTVYSCATAEEGKFVFAGDNASSVYCFSQEGQRLWKLSTGCGSALSMQFLEDRLYLVTTDGSIACLDASEGAIEAAQTGTLPKTVTIKAPPLPVVTASAPLETASSNSPGVKVECYQEGGKLRIRVISPGFNPTWHVQFPKDIRQEGCHYLVDEIRESGQGGFYRVYGDIKKLSP